MAEDPAEGFDVFGLAVVLGSVSVVERVGGDAFIYPGFPHVSFNHLLKIRGDILNKLLYL